MLAYNELLNAIKKNKYEKKVLVWGACSKNDEIVEALKREGIGIYGYIDRKCNEKYNGFEIFDKKILEKDKYFVYVGIRYFCEDITDFLRKKGYKEFEDYWYQYRRVEFNGKENYSDIYGNKCKIGEETKLNIIFGGNATCVIGNNNIFDKSSYIYVGENSFLEIGDNCIFKKNPIVISCGSIKIGSNVSIEGNGRIETTSEGNVYIGNDCMLSTDVIVQSGSGHNLYDLETNENLSCNVNHKNDIIIHEHVWVGRRACIFNGAEIGNGSVVGINSLVNKKFPNNSCIAGIPAKILRKKVAWRRDSTPLFDSYDDFKQFDYTNEEE